MKRILGILVLALLIAGIGGYLTREARNRHDASVAGKLVEVLGGTIGSIQPPLSPDKEYCVTLPDKLFTRADLERLIVFNQLSERNYVVIYFEGDLDASDILYLKQLLPAVGIMVKNKRITELK